MVGDDDNDGNDYDGHYDENNDDYDDYEDDGYDNEEHYGENNDDDDDEGVAKYALDDVILRVERACQSSAWYPLSAFGTADGDGGDDHGDDHDDCDDDDDNNDERVSIICMISHCAFLTGEDDNGDDDGDDQDDCNDDDACYDYENDETYYDWPS